MREPPQSIGLTSTAVKGSWSGYVTRRAALSTAAPCLVVIRYDARLGRTESGCRSAT
ncbi:hypothetical protein C7S17_5653 [Burkholderia thailandensis]|nr:hypothetical protein [Burkholderia thailandensis]